MIGTVQVAGPDAPQGGGKDDDGQEEEDAHNFKPQNAANAAEGAQEPAHAPGNAAAGLSGRLTGGMAVRGCAGIRLMRGRTRRCLGAGAYPLAHNAPGDAQSDAQYPADRVRFHFDMMVPAALGWTALHRLYPFACCPRTATEVR